MKLRPFSATLVCLVCVTTFASFLQLAVALHTVITNVKCLSLNKSCIEYNECRLRAVKRNWNEISVLAKVVQPPIVSAAVQIQFMKKSNGYRPYMAEQQFDVCKMLLDQAKPLEKYLFSFLRPYTNINHSCPINHDIMLKNFRINQDLLNGAGLVPSGDYAFFNTWTINKIKCARTEMYFTYKE